MTERFEDAKQLSEIQGEILPMPPYEDLIAQARSGSDKTVLGMLGRVDMRRAEPQALCICPSRETANENMKVLQKVVGITAELAVPGERRGRDPLSVHVVIGTPATLKKLISFKKLSVRNIKFLVFDEADRMLDVDGFRDDSLKIVKEIKKANPNLQVLLFSATLNQAVKDFAGKTLKDPNNLLLVEERKQDKVVEDEEKINVFNSLPDAVICHILSFLPTKKAASASVLSRRWRYLLASVPNLEFDDLISLHPDEKENRQVLDRWSWHANNFVNFVERVLALHHDFTVDKFSLKIAYCYDPELVARWIRKVLECGVSDVHLVTDCGWDWGLDFQLPTELFISETLVRLKIKIVGEPANINVEDFHLPKLKALYLETVMFREKDIGLSKLLAGCKVLEELSLEAVGAHMWDSYSVSVTSLKRLTFHTEAVAENPSSVSFDTPNLVNLEYTGVNARKYPQVNFDSLVEAKIDLWLTGDQWRLAKSIAKASGSELEALSREVNHLFGDSTNLIKGICNVQSLYLSGSTLEVLNFCCKDIPIFRNLTHLAITSLRSFGWKSLPRLLKSCPNLETLVFRGILHRCKDICLCKSPKEDDLTCLSTSPVKVVKFLINGGNMEKHIELLKQFSHTMPNLEQLVLYYDSCFDHDLVLVSTQLQRAASSPKCKVQLIPSDLFVLPKWGRYYCT